MNPRHALWVLVLLFLPACWSMDQADLLAIGKRHQIEMTEAECCEDATPLKSLIVAKDGFYILGFIPIIKISLRDAVIEAAEIAQKDGADGVCRLRYDLSPPSPFKFLVWPLPDWSAKVRVWGMTYRRDKKSGTR